MAIDVFTVIRTCSFGRTTIKPPNHEIHQPNKYLFYLSKNVRNEI